MILRRKPDGGKDSGVISWGIEIKRLFSAVLLRFEPNSRENYHSHAFNAVTVWLKGSALEERILPSKYTWYTKGHIKYTSRKNVHKIHCYGGPVWALSIRGPWKNEWSEYTTSRQEIKLTHGRQEVCS